MVLDMAGKLDFWKKEDSYDLFRVFVTFILFFLAIGFLIGLIFPYQRTMCTEMGCSCVEQGTGEPDEDGVWNCNSCTEKDTVFRTWVFNVVREREGTEIIECGDGEIRMDTRYVEWDDDWSYRIGFG